MKRKIIVTVLTTSVMLSGCGFNTPVSEVVSDLTSAISSRSERENISDKEETEDITEVSTDTIGGHSVGGKSISDNSSILSNDAASTTFNNLEAILDLETAEELPWDYLGSYNGTGFSLGSNDVSIFTDDNWYFEYYDNNYSYEKDSYSVTMSNDDHFWSWLTVKTIIGSYSSDQEVAEGITANGFYGYSISVSGDDNKPDMTFNGLTWSATVEDVMNAYGRDYYSYSDFENGTYIEYKITDSAYLQFEISKEWEYNSDIGLNGVSLTQVPLSE